MDHNALRKAYMAGYKDAVDMFCWFGWDSDVQKEAKDGFDDYLKRLMTVPPTDKEG